MEIKIKYLNEFAKIPLKQTEGSAGFDLYAIQDQVIEVGKAGLVKLGVTIEIPTGFEGQIRSRSGLALKNSVFVLNSPGTIDSDYRGELGVLLMNLGQQEFLIKQGDRIAQLVIAKVENPNFKVSEISNSSRNEDGWGSTGI